MQVWSEVFSLKILKFSISENVWATWKIQHSIHDQQNRKNVSLTQIQWRFYASKFAPGCCVCNVIFPFKKKFMKLLSKQKRIWEFTKKIFVGSTDRRDLEVLVHTWRFSGFAKTKIEKWWNLKNVSRLEIFEFEKSENLITLRSGAPGKVWKDSTRFFQIFHMLKNKVVEHFPDSFQFTRFFEIPRTRI